MIRKGVISEIEREFGRVSDRLSEQVIKQFGNDIGGREEDISAGLKTELTLNLLNNIKKRLNRKTINNVQFKVEVFRKKTESITGADLGFVLKIVHGENVVKKGFLAQSKVCDKKKPKKGNFYYYCPPRAANVHSNVLKQADAMLNYTSDSFFFLYTKDGVKVVPAFSIKLNGKRGVDTRDFYFRHFRFFMKDFFKCFVGDHKVGKMMDFGEKHLLSDDFMNDQFVYLIDIEAKIIK